MSVLSHIPYDIVIFAIISILLALRLRSVLGRRMGVQEMAAVRNVASPRAVQPRTDVAPKVEEPGAALDIPAPATRVGGILGRMALVEPGFSPEKFLRGVETSFRNVVTAFAMGDREKLRAALTPDAYAGFAAAIDAREAAGEVQRTEIVAIQSLAIQDADVAEPAQGVTRGLIDVLIVSRQISLLNDRDSQPLVGTESVTEFSDLWRFERVFGAQTGGASWRLAAARAA